MHIVIFLLKVLGILLLCISIVIFLVLFYPVSYSIKGEISESTAIHGKIRWLFGIIGIDIPIHGTSISYELKLFGKRIFPSRKKEPLTTQAEKQASASAAKMRLQKDIRNEKKENKNRETLNKEPEHKKTVVPESVPLQQAPLLELSPQADTKSRNPFVKFQKWFQKLKSVILNFDRRKSVFRRLQSAFHRFWKEYKNETNRLALSHIWQEILYLFRKLQPYHLKADFVFGSSNPAWTGQILGILSLLPFIYQYNIQICPDFEAQKEYIQGKFKCRGFIFPWQILAAFLRIYKDRAVKKMFYKIRKSGGFS